MYAVGEEQKKKKKSSREQSGDTTQVTRNAAHPSEYKPSVAVPLRLRPFLACDMEIGKRQGRQYPDRPTLTL